MSEDGLICIKNVSIIRGGKRVLKDISWTTLRGEHWFLMGNNGSGKTTLLEIVLGYLWPQKGEVYVLGEKFGRVFLPDLRKRIGFIAPWVLKRIRPSVPVYDVIASGEDSSIGFFGNVSKELDSRVRKEAKLFGCTPFLRSPFGNLSSGQQIRAALARAMVHQSEILILDEPFSHLDICTRARTYDLIERLSRRKGGPQIIMVTHHVEDVRPFFTHGLLIRDGRAAAQGKKEHLFQKNVMGKILEIPKSFFKNEEILK